MLCHFIHPKEAPVTANAPHLHDRLPKRGAAPRAFPTYGRPHWHIVGRNLLSGPPGALRTENACSSVAKMHSSGLGSRRCPVSRLAPDAPLPFCRVEGSASQPTPRSSKWLRQLSRIASGANSRQPQAAFRLQNRAGLPKSLTSGATRQKLDRSSAPPERPPNE
jgi:hypothetical protein